MAAYVVVFLSLCMLKCSATINLTGRPGSGYHVKVLIGTPPQSFNLLLDTGSTNMAIAGAPRPELDKYFHRNLSSTCTDLDEKVSLVYTQGAWSGDLVRDYVDFPELNSVPRVECDISLITNSYNFYMNQSDWQGILGLAYPAIARPSSDVMSWIDFVQRKRNDRNIAFSLKLCGSRTLKDDSHYGLFKVLNNVDELNVNLLNALVVREWFYEVVLTGLSVNGISIPLNCNILNKDQTIVDSGTTNLHLPTAAFDELVKLLISATADDAASNYTLDGGDNQTISYMNFTKEFWKEQRENCWTEPQTWLGMPIVNLEIASGENSYIRLNLPASSYIRLSHDDSNEKNFCYKFAIEPTNTGTVIGVIALEGFEVIFNRTSHTVGFMKSDCGPNVSLEGPFLTGDVDMIRNCWNKKIVRLNLLHIAGYIVCVAMFFVSCIFVYMLVQWFKVKYFKYRNSQTFVSVSHMSLRSDDS